MPPSWATQLSLMGRYTQRVISALLAGLLLWWFLRSIDMAVVGDRLARIRVDYLVAATGLSLGAMVYRAWRWRYLVAPLGFRLDEIPRVLCVYGLGRHGGAPGPAGRNGQADAAGASGGPRQDGGVRDGRAGTRAGHAVRPAPVGDLPNLFPGWRSPRATTRRPSTPPFARGDGSSWPVWPALRAWCSSLCAFARRRAIGSSP